jgi:hypothetical protein
VNLLGDNTNMVKKNIGAVIDAGKELDLEVNAEKPK